MGVYIYSWILRNLALYSENITTCKNMAVILFLIKGFLIVIPFNNGQWSFQTVFWGALDADVLEKFKMKSKRTSACNFIL